MPQTSNKKQYDLGKFKRFKSSIDHLKQHHYYQDDQTALIVSIANQRLYLINNKKVRTEYIISSAELGFGYQSGSHQTPLGIHKISEKFGENAISGTIFKARENTHTIAKILTDPNTKSDADYITSRILWLEGLEKGINQGFDSAGNNVDSHSRFIYIHGTDEEGQLGQAASHGCVRMANKDIIQLFDKVDIGCLVIIQEA